MYTGKFSKGAKIVRDDGTEENLEGQPFVMRETTNFVRIQAARAVKRLDSTDEIEVPRAMIVSVNGQPVKEWADWSHCNARAALDVNIAMGIANGWAHVGKDGSIEVGEAPLDSTSGGSAPTS